MLGFFILVMLNCNILKDFKKILKLKLIKLVLEIEMMKYIFSATKNIFWREKVVQ